MDESDEAFPSPPYLSRQSTASLIAKIGASTLDIKCWLLAYLRDRKIPCQSRGATSGWRKLRVGVLQGSVSSPCIFNLFVNDISAPSASTNGSCADDFHDVLPSIIADRLPTAAKEILMRRSRTECRFCRQSQP